MRATSVTDLDATWPIHQPTEVLNPVSGELVPLDGATNTLAEYLLDVRDLESRLREAKSLVSREILKRMDYYASYTIEFPGIKVSGDSPAPTIEYDAKTLHDDLALLAEADVFAPEALEAAIDIITTYKVKRAGLKALEKLGPAVRDVIEKHAHEAERDRRVSVRVT
jgi:hypothetical protein